MAWADFWASVKAKLWAFWNGPGGRIVQDATAEAVATVGRVGLSMLMEAGKAKAAEVERLSLPGSQKQGQVKDYLEAYGKNLGLQVSTSLLLWVVETAVQAMKAEKR